MTDLPKASVGRIVLFKSTNLDQVGNGAEEVPAIITRAWSDTMLNLCVFRDANAPLAVTSVGHESISQGSSLSWRWPPRV